ncbi:CCA tRNA nucleotidyltransferase [Bacillus sp. DTU_2020_1000418_1_SI_GHA_SEK_038]|uniref:CCA tRNA nucleotidyltransferase n=1 Tax=Bacillus sp. DTU_2020_1000418_1_SI_GHA_SEK_038 TaxID=3077585 RepID=UPI0028E6A8D7|nr:CCA tRNA nucleotidyltransferase [Bacillus sp. DTU_2020_1000418_1_SI_GHA_SEK_038]WNS74009.1 CCA tRNA nucleotidyltransferase [Bacillus sp. DTU_2020_1000418_1_SI_GHA_SEK_038]
MKESFLKAIPLLSKIQESGYEAYFVGGSVRDYLLEKEIADVDIATSATPDEIRNIFPKTVDVGIEHGTIIVLFNGIPYEVTTFRTEAEYVDFRRPSEVQFIRSLHEDLKRRDFTMNAIAMDKEGRFIDPFLGRQAIKEKMIKTVGKAEDRFSEDALRMMRAVRFYSQLGFRIEETTYQALKTSASLLAKISTERKLAEFEKLLAGNNRIQALLVLADTGLLNYLPGMKPHIETITNIAKYDCSKLSVNEMWGLLLYLFKIDLHKVNDFMKNWKLPVKQIKKIHQLLFWLDFRERSNWTNKAMFDAGAEIIEGTEKIYNVLHNQDVIIDIERLLLSYHLLPIKQRGELQVTGTDLQEWYQKSPGPWIKEKLGEVEVAVLNKQISNRKDSLKEWLLGCNQS